MKAKQNGINYQTLNEANIYKQTTINSEARSFGSAV